MLNYPSICIQPSRLHSTIETPFCTFIHPRVNIRNWIGLDGFGVAVAISNVLHCVTGHETASKCLVVPLAISCRVQCFLLFNPTQAVLLFFLVFGPRQHLRIWNFCYQAVPWCLSAKLQVQICCRLLEIFSPFPMLIMICHMLQQAFCITFNELLLPCNELEQHKFALHSRTQEVFHVKKQGQM